MFLTYFAVIFKAAPSSNIDYLININQSSSMNRLMTYFLSRCRMPNLLVPKKLNVADNFRSMDKSKLRDLMKRCEDDGFLTFDLSAPVVGMIENKLPVEFELGAEIFSLPLHPLTLINHRSGKGLELVQTDYLSTAAGQKYLFDCFDD